MVLASVIWPLIFRDEVPFLLPPETPPTVGAFITLFLCGGVSVFCAG